jgi:hypothetical protein
MRTYIYVLSQGDGAVWFHPNEHVARWGRIALLEKIAENANRRGCKTWEVYAQDEQRLAASPVTEHSG